jgi:hypothetical protein
MGWHGVKKSPLLLLIVESGFQAFLTFDKNLQHQQILKKIHTITVFVLSAINNTYAELSKLIPKIQRYLTAETLPRELVIITP